MTDAPLANIPTHLIAGPLGAGKTSLIRHLLTQRPASERWAVLVNEFGQVGIDAALLDTGADGVSIAEIAGGCLCCVNGVPFQVGLARLLRRTRPDRLIIEMSGLGHPAPLLRQLVQPPWDSVLRVHPLTMVLDAGVLAAGQSLSDGQREALDLAGLVVLNKAEMLDAPARERVDQRITARQRIWCSQGQLPLASLPAHMANETDANAAFAGSEQLLHAMPNPTETRRLWLSPEQWHRSEQRLDADTSLGWVMSPALRFNRLALDHWLSAVAWKRAKGVVHTTEGWLRFNAVRGAPIEWEHHTARPDNRIELISDSELDAPQLEASLRDTVHCG